MTNHQEFFKSILQFNHSWVREVRDRFDKARELAAELEKLTGSPVPPSLDPESIIEETKDTGLDHYHKAADLQIALNALEDAVEAATPPSSGIPQSVIVKFGITWTLDQQYETGQYINGDYWVVGPVKVVGISPGATKLEGVDGNGSMVNPWVAQRGPQKPGMQQGYHQNMYGQYNVQNDYNAELNVGLRSEIDLKPGDSLISTVTDPGKDPRPRILNAAVLTVVDKAPPANAFRPGHGRTKGKTWTLDDVDRSRFAKLPKISGTPGIREMVSLMDGLWLQHATWWPTRYMNPANHMPNYGREISDRIGTATLLLNMDHSNDPEAYEQLLIHVVQLGLDLYHMASDARDGKVLDQWMHAAAGHHSGRKWPILLAGIVFRDDDMKTITHIDAKTGAHFQEDGQTFYVEETEPGVYNNGFGEYTAEDVGLAEWGSSHLWLPKNDDKTWFGDPYRSCCTANAWWAQGLSALVMGARQEWNHEPYFDYMDRYRKVQGGYLQSGTVAGWQVSWTKFPLAMWDAYRENY
jgi:hypothetical protein